MTSSQHCPPCPKCRNVAHVQVTLKSDFGWYCRCEHCGYLWHDSAIPPPSYASFDSVPVAQKPE